MFISVLVRRLKPGKTYDDFVRAWYPDEGFGLEFGGRGPILARNIADEGEIAAIAFMDAPDREAVERTLERIGDQEATRHDRIDEVIESTSVRGIFEVADEFDFSTDETVARGRPADLER